MTQEKREDFCIGFHDPHIGKIVRIDDVTPPAPPRQIDYIFEVTGYEARVMLGDHQLEHLSGWTEGGKPNAFESAQRFCDKHHVTHDSQIDVRVVEKKSYARYRPTKARDYGPKFDALSFGSCWDVPPSTETIIWSSKKDLELSVEPPPDSSLPPAS